MTKDQRCKEENDEEVVQAGPPVQQALQLQEGSMRQSQVLTLAPCKVEALSMY